ncbi:MAG: translation elongation factor Ts [Patescibacteria group bacterium]
MTNITATDVAKLRSQTGAGMMDCKKALEEAGGDMDVAADILRKKGITKAAKRADKVASEGLVYGLSTGKVGALVEVNSETDFVANGEDFINFTKAVTQAVVDNNVNSVEALSAVKLPSGQTVSETLNALTLKLGEKMNIRRIARFEGDLISVYLHGTKIGVMVELSGGDVALGSEIAMHIAAANPKYLTRSEVPTEVLDKEKEIYAEQLRQQGKPDNIIENILKGKMDKFYGEICLPEQPFIKDEEKTIQKLLTEKGAKVKKFVRYELGEGIEKIAKNFADEVAEQMG